MGRTPVPADVYKTVMFRSEDTAQAACEAMIRGVCTYTPEHWHHRRMRSQGGGHHVANGLAVCSACHSRIHATPSFSYERGFLVHGWEEPADRPVLRRGSWSLLYDDGTVEKIDWRQSE